ncbi:cher methyltransferase [Pelagophyceae sp. CCMP2097]|nr:cher methyltransferase [Pelagophyceae sp. CCMP2097]
MVAGPECYKVYSRFARDADVYLYTVDRIFYGLARRAAAEGRNSVRVWSVGCAGGEEPFSIAVAWTAALADVFPNVQLEIVATDNDEPSLRRAAAGVFDTHAVQSLPLEWIARCFDVVDDGGDRRAYALRPEVRACVSFAHADFLASPLPPGDFDLVLCRYSLFLYLPSALCRPALDKLVPSIRSGGYLVTGASDTLPQGYANLGLVNIHGGDAPGGVYRVAAAADKEAGGRRAVFSDDDLGDNLPPTLTDLVLGGGARAARDVFAAQQAQQPSFVSSRSRQILKAGGGRRPLSLPALADGGAPAAAPAFHARPLPPLYAKAKAALRAADAARQRAVDDDEDDASPPPAARRPLSQSPSLAAPSNARRAPSSAHARGPPADASLGRLAGARSDGAACRVEDDAQAPRRTLSADDLRALVERMMADVVRREQHITALRAEAAAPQRRAAPRLTPGALSAFIARMRADADRAARALARLRAACDAAHPAAPGGADAAPGEARATAALAGLRTLARAQEPLVSLRPPAIVRYMLRQCGRPAAARLEPRDDVRHSNVRLAPPSTQFVDSEHILLKPMLRLGAATIHFDRPPLTAPS